MKIELKYTEPELQQYTFPCLAKSKVYGYTLLFLSDTVAYHTEQQIAKTERLQLNMEPLSNHKSWTILPKGTSVTFTQE